MLHKGTQPDQPPETSQAGGLFCSPDDAWNLDVVLSALDILEALCSSDDDWHDWQAAGGA
jgi:hypothetical protein